MISLGLDSFKKLKRAYNKEDIEETTYELRKAFANNGDFSIFNMVRELNTMVILFDNKGTDITRYISFPDDITRNYLVLDASRSVEQMRFDVACMLGRIARQVSHEKKDFCPNITTVSNKFSREDKYFACALLMPKKTLVKMIMEKDSNSNYLYLDENGELPFKYVHIIADRLGVPFNQCLSRIFHVFDSMNKGSDKKVYLKGCYTKRQYEKLKEEYEKKDKQKDLEEVVPNYKQREAKRLKHLIDSLHYRPYSKLSLIAKRKLLVNLVQFDSVNEGVVKDPNEVKKIINQYIASEGKIRNGKLVTDTNTYDLTDEQLVILGEYEMYNKTLEKGLIMGLAHSKDDHSLMKKDYLHAIESLTEYDISQYICELHRSLFKNLSEKYHEERGGFYRTHNVSLAGTTVNPASPFMIKQIVDNISWRILETLKKNARGELTNSQYIEQVDEAIYELIRTQPFGDGNKRTARLLANVLYQEKGIPYVLVPPRDWNAYIDAWSSDNMDKYNELMQRLIIDSYGYFYGDQSIGDVTHTRKVDSKKIITGKRI